MFLIAPYVPRPSIVPPLWVSLPIDDTLTVKSALDVILPFLLDDKSSIVTLLLIVRALLPIVIVWPFKFKFAATFIAKGVVTTTSFSNLILPPVASASASDINPCPSTYATELGST